MRVRTGIVAALALLLAPAIAHPQSVPVYQLGNLELGGDVAKMVRNGTIEDAGGILGDAASLGVNPFAITDHNGQAVCADSDITANPYNALCLGHDATGNGLITLDSYGLAAKQLYVRLNGTLYPFPGSGTGTGDVTGPASSVAGDVAAFSDTTGKVLKDGGVLPVLPASVEGNALCIGSQPQSPVDCGVKAYPNGATLPLYAGTINGPATIQTYLGGPLPLTGGVGSITGGSGYGAGSYANVPLTGGTNTGAPAQATIVVSGGAVTSVTITAGGTTITAPQPTSTTVGYEIGDVLSASAANIGGTGSGFSFPVTALGLYETSVPASATVVEVILKGGDGSGGAGAQTASGTSASGGAGGGGGAYCDMTMPASALPATFGIAVGQGGLPSIPAATTSTAGAPGNPGTASEFYASSANEMFAYGGGAGAGGQINANSGGGAGANCLGNTASGTGSTAGTAGPGAGSGASGNSGNAGVGAGGGGAGGLNGGIGYTGGAAVGKSGPGGGSGGGVAADGTLYNGGTGNRNAATGASDPAGGTSGSPNGVSGQPALGFAAGQSGGGGYSGGNGGNSGGGGSVLNGGTPGYGARGADGFVVVLTW